MGEYGSVTLQFSDLPSNFNNSDWQERLKMSVKSAIVNAIPADQRQLVLVEVRDFLKRAAESKKVLYLYVDANILPLEYSSERTASAKQVSWKTSIMLGCKVMHPYIADIFICCFYSNV